MAAGDVPVPDDQNYKEIENQLENRTDPNGKGIDWSDHSDSDPGAPILGRQPTSTGTDVRAIDLPVIIFDKDAEKLVIPHETDWDEDSSDGQADQRDDGSKRRN